MNTNNKTKWFSDARFGMFIHWGLPALLGRGEWVMYQENIPPPEYRRLAGGFNPRRYRPDEWVTLAKASGIKYMVLCAKHHDGFCLFDSRHTDFTSVKTAARRDLVGEFVSACHRAKMKVGLYFSLPDWQWPVFSWGPQKDPEAWLEFRVFVHNQVRELCSNYGKIDLLWFDYMVPRGQQAPYSAEDWESANMAAMIRRLQPHILINNRAGLPGDFDTPEGHIKASAPGRPWEACMTMNNHWGWFADDDFWKPARQLVHMLTACATGGGNFLLNVGPKPDGTIPLESAKRLREMGRWLKVNGEAIYGTGRSSFNTGTAGCAAQRGKKIYMFVHWWPGKELALPAIPGRIRSAYVLSTGKEVKMEPRGTRLFLTGLPANAPDPLTTVIVMKH